MKNHAYRLQILKEGRVPVGEPVDLSLSAVLQRGVEALHWRSFVAGDRGEGERLRVSPRWSELGKPVVEAILLETGSRSLAMPAKRLFAAVARRESTRMVESEVLEPGVSYGFVVTARPAVDAPKAPVFHLDDYPVSDGLPEPAGQAVDSEFAGPDDFPVHVSKDVLEEALRLAGNAGDVETGGVLFGLLKRSAEGKGVMLEVTHLCPAADGRGDGASFTFTPETWSVAQDMLSARAAGEMMVGWWHSHPDFCRNCSNERQRICTLRRPFFSEDDVRLHESVFPAAYSVGLLASHDGTRFVPSLWGWRDGFVSRRSYLTNH